MSRVKSPQQKKRLSLARDRRNVYGENDKASRKNVPRARQRSQMRIRRSAKRELRTAIGEFDELGAIEAESRLRDRAKSLKSQSFEKTRDLPLGIVIERQEHSRIYRAISAALRRESIQEVGPCRVSLGRFYVSVRKQDVERTVEIISDILKKSKHAKSGNGELERRFWLYGL
jgi:hypothetical protein